MSLNQAESAPEDAARIVPVAKGEDGLELPVTSFAVGGLLDSLVAVGAKGVSGETARVLIDGQLYVSVGLGSADEIDDEAVRRAFGAAARSLSGVEEAAVSCEFGTRPVVEGLLLGGYSYQGLKSSDSPSTPAAVTVVGADPEEFEHAVAVAESVNFARDLV